MDYIDRNILEDSHYVVSKTFPEIPALGVQNYRDSPDSAVFWSPANRKLH